MGEPDKDADGKPKVQQPKLPDNAPAALKQFLECKGNRLTFKPGKLPFVKGKPSITFEAGEKAGEVKVSIGWGILSLTIPASVKDGQLTVDTTTAQQVFKAASEFSDDLKDFDPKAIDDWVKELNDWLKANNRKLGPLELKDGKLTISKVAAAAPPQKAMAPGAPAGKGAPAPATPGLKGKVAVGGAAMLLGFGLGGVAGDLWGGGSGDVALPTGAVPVTAAQASEAEPEVEIRTVVSLPDGPVDASLTFTHLASGESFENPATFEQAGRDLTLTVTGVDSFQGTMDDGGSFSVSNSQGSFDGTIQGDQVEADHVFQGEDFTIQGTLAQPAVEEQVTEEGTDGQSEPVLAGSIGADVQVASTADGGEDGANVPLAAAGGLLTAVGTGLLVTRTIRDTKECDEEQAALEAALADLAEESKRQVELQERLERKRGEAPRLRDDLESLLPKGVELEREGVSTSMRIDETTLPFGGLFAGLANRQDSEAEVQRALSSYNDALSEIHWMELELSNTGDSVVEAEEAVIAAERDLAECEGRAPRSLSELPLDTGLTDRVM